MKDIKLSYNKILWTFCLILFSVSCENLLTEDPKGKLFSDTFFTNSADMDMALNSLYFNVAQTLGQNNYTGLNLFGSDDITTHPSSNKGPLREFDQFQVADNNSWMQTVWLQYWKIVKNANFILNSVDKTPVSAEEIGYVKAQAAYWRAYAYFYLVRTWGKIPIMLEEEINYESTLDSEQAVYDLIVADLKIAEGARVNYTSVPYQLNGRNIGVSQAAAKATLAYVYMTMAGWPLNKGTEYYQMAAAKALEVIEGVENQTYNYSLLDEYWKVHSIEYNFNNPEVIIAAYYNRDRTANMSSLCDFPGDAKQGGWNDMCSEIKFWKDFPDGPRKEATYFPKLLLNDGILHDWWFDSDPPREMVAPFYMKTAETSVRGAEFDYTADIGAVQNGEKSHHIVRLSEVYCWYAEAVGRSGQINAKAIEVLNKVRNRADGAVTNIYTSISSADDLAEAAYNEHGWEIAGYYWGALASRYWDLFRMNRLKDHFEYRKLNPMIEVAPGVLRNEKVAVTGTWDDSKMYAPYPSKDVILNPNLKR